MEPITTVIAAVAFDIVKGVCGNRADAIAVKNWQRLRENLNTYQPDANHDLQKAIHRAYLQAALQVCALRAEQLGTNVSAWFSFASKAIAAIKKVRSRPLAGLLTEGEKQWLETVSRALFEQIKELNRDDYQLPAASDNAELEQLKQAFELLLQPAGIEAREQEIRTTLTARALRDIESKHHAASPEFRALFNGQWYGLLCGCFQYQIKNDPKVADIFTGKLLAGIYVRGNDGSDEAISIEFVQNAFAQLGGDLSHRFDATDALIKLQSQQLDRLEQDALVPLLALEHNTAARTRRIEDLLTDIRADVQAARSDIHSDGELTRQTILSRLDDLTRGGTFARMGKAEPLLLLTPTGERLIVDREPECAAILRELKSATGLRVLPIVAPGGFGKTALVTKTLRAVTDGQHITDADVQAILRLDCQQGRLTLGRIFIEAGRLVGQSETFQQVYAAAELALQDRLDYLFRELSRAGNVWIILDTFEDMLGADATVTDKEVEAFVHYCLSHEQGVRLILTTREIPKLAGRHALAPLAAVNDALMQGLPEADAISYLRSEGAQCGLGEREATDELLRDFCRRVHRIPMALRSVVGYLSDEVYPAVTLKDLMEDGDTFRDFDHHDAESGLKSLIARQLDRLHTEAQMLLAMLAFFGKAVPQDAIELLMPKDKLVRALNRLYTNKLVNRETDRFGINRYSLHPIILDQARLTLAAHESRINEEFARGCRSLAYEADDKARFRLALDMYDCCEMLYRHLITASTRSELLNDLAMALMNKGVALQNLGRLGQAIACYDEAIAISRRLAAEGREELANDLAMALMNKGGALGNLDRLDEAIAYYDEAITVTRGLVKGGREELANDLASTLKHEGIALANLGRLSEAMSYFDEAIDIYRRLVESGRDELAHELAGMLMNKAIMLKGIEAWDDALALGEEAIHLSESCVVNAKMEHLLPDLLRMFRDRLTMLFDLRRWAEAQPDMRRFLAHATPFTRADEVPDAVAREIAAMHNTLRKLSAEDRAQLLAAMGDDADSVQRFIED